MFEHLRRDFTVHGRTLRHRAFWAIIHYRFGRWVMRFRFPPARWLGGKLYGLLTIPVQIVSGVAIDRRMSVGEGFHLVHGGMVLIHPDVIIGDRVGVMHGVTIGVSPGAGVPTIGNDVFIGAGAVVIGAIKLGDGCRIAANSLVMCDVPAGGMAIGVPAKVFPASPKPDAQRSEPAQQQA